MEHINIPNALGLVGVFLILLAYGLIQSEKIDPKGWRYSCINLLGASLIVYSLLYAFNLSAFVIEICWVIISLYGLFKYLVRHKYLD